MMISDSGLLFGGHPVEARQKLTCFWRQGWAIGKGDL